MIIKLEAYPQKDKLKVYLKTFNSVEYEQQLEIIDGEITINSEGDENWNCTCKWGSIGRYKGEYKNKQCKHIKECIELLTYLGYLKFKNV